MANIAALLKRIESGTLSYEEKLSALSQVEQSLQDMRQKKQEAIQSNVMLIVDALKQMQVKVEQQLEEAKAIVPQKGQKGDKGEKGERGLDGAPGKDGRNGIDGKDGKDGNDGISVTDAKIDFDGSLVITLSNGREINVGEVLPLEVSDKIKVIANGGGTSQTVVDTLTSLQNQINTLTGIDGVLGDMAQQNANNVAITGGAINGATIGGVTPAAGTFTTLTATGQTSLGGVAGSESLRVLSSPSYTSWVEARGSNTSNPGIRSSGTGTLQFDISAQAGGSVRFYSASYTTQQFQISHTASAVNYVQVTGAATGSFAQISAQGSDAITGLGITSKGAARINFFNNNGTNRQVSIGGNGAAAVNYLDLNGSATGIATSIGPAGSDTNIALAFQSKGTGAIDLAAGSSGVNISNGGTVTALTRTAGGSGYTSFPSVAITAPTTSGGVQATASAQLVANAAAVAGGGTGYTNGDVLTVSTAGGSSPITITVTGVTGGVITSATTNSSALTSIPTSPVSVTGGTGTGATFNLTYVVAATFTITNAGSGYVEQPTVTFSGGGGSGAAAYATVGSGTVIRSLGSTGNQSLDFYTPTSITSSIPALRIRDLSGSDSYPMVQGGSSVTSILAQGNTNATLVVGANGGGGVRFTTSGTGLLEQLRVSHTASAVNYVQVTGAATGGAVQITTQGSDNNVGTIYGNKGVGSHSFRTGGTTSIQFQITNTTNAVNRLEVTGGVAGASPVLACLGADTNIDLALTAKGTGSVNLNTGNGVGFKVMDTGSAAVNFLSAINQSAGNGPRLRAEGADTNVNMVLSSKGTGSMLFFTNTEANRQFTISHTASAVNYVQVTGAATTIRPAITAQGSDTNIGLSVYTKGTGQVVFGNGGQFAQFRINGAVNAVNYLQVDGSLTGAAPVLSALGSDTNIDLALTPKGTGRVKFGTHTATADTAVSGYIEIVDSGGTVRKLAVIT